MSGEFGFVMRSMFYYSARIAARRINVEENQDTVLMHEIKRGEGEAIRIALRKYAGKFYIDLRLWFKDEHGETRPTRKGFTMTPEVYRDLITEARNEPEALRNALKLPTTKRGKRGKI